MKRMIIGLCAATGLAACGGGTAPFGEQEGDADTSANSAFLTEQNPELTANNISYDPDTDVLTINNIPFDDPNNEYVRITTENFSNGFDAYQSAPAPGSNEFQYFAVFRRSDSGQSQVAAAGSDEFISFGFGGAGAQRLGGRPNLPSSGIYSYSGEYAAVRTTRNTGGIGDGVQYVTGDVELTADFGDFDDIGAVGGVINNRQVHNTAGQPLGALDGFITLANGAIDFETSQIIASTATEIRGGDQTANGDWSGVFAGPGGNEIAGIVFVEGSGIRETGGIIAECSGAPCP